VLRFLDGQTSHLLNTSCSSCQSDYSPTTRTCITRCRRHVLALWLMICFHSAASKASSSHRCSAHPEPLTATRAASSLLPYRLFKLPQWSFQPPLAPPSKLNGWYIQGPVRKICEVEDDWIRNNGSHEPLQEET
jgi:hypothetical protein